MEDGWREEMDEMRVKGENEGITGLLMVKADEFLSAGLSHVHKLKPLTDISGNIKARAPRTFISFHVIVQPSDQPVKLGMCEVMR